MRVGLTGSSGLIGRALATALTERGDEVVRFVRPGGSSGEGTRVRWDPGAGVVDEGDLRSLGGLDAIVNLAGAGIGDRRWTTKRREDIAISRTATTSLVVEAIERLAAGVGTLVSASAVGFYGESADTLLGEGHPAGTDFLARVCAAWEDEAARAQRLGTRVATIRTGIVMSASGGALGRQLPLFRRGLGGVLGTGRQWVSPISLVDEVRAILWILDTDQEGPHNLVAPAPVTNREFTEALASAVGRHARLPVPALALDVALGRGLARGAVLASQRAIPERLSAEGFAFVHADIASILSAALSL